MVSDSEEPSSEKEGISMKEEEMKEKKVVKEKVKV